MVKIKYSWVTAAFIITVIFGTIYAAVQQSIRTAANDPQIQIAEDIGDMINKGSDPQSYNASTKINAAATLQPFIIIYDKSGKEVASTVELDGKTPALPKGVLDHATPQNRVTWEPKEGVRIAAVVQSTNKGYILAGRNMREVEKREDIVFKLSALGWLISEAALLGMIAYKTKFISFNKHQK